jgi:hypothetical protein
MTTVTKSPSIMTRALSHAKITPRRSSARGHADHGWLDSYHTFSFAQYYSSRFQSFGALRVLNEDRVAPGRGFPTHQHRDAEIFSYILDGELTHRDSMHGHEHEGRNNNQKDDFFSRLSRNDIQFTTGGTGIAHSEQNEHASKPVHFLQIWVLPWKKSLRPIYHTKTFPESDKRQKFVTLISPLQAGPHATASEEEAAVPAVEGTIPIHADFVMGAAIIPPGQAFSWVIGGGSSSSGSSGEGKTDDGADDAAAAAAAAVVRSRTNRKTYVHLPMTKRGLAKIRLAGKEDVVLEEGDGAFVENVNAGDELWVSSIGEEEAEVVVLDSD